MAKRPDDPAAGLNGRERALLELIGATATLFHRLHRVSERLHGGGTLSAGRRALLLDLATHGPQTVAHLARKRPVARQYIQLLAKDLERDGYVERATNPAHRRSPLVRLTARGRRRAGAIEAREAALLRTGRLPVGERELRAAGDTLRRVRAFFEGEEWAARLPRRRGYTARREQE